MLTLVEIVAIEMGIIARKMDWIRALVTGGASYISSNIVPAMLKAGAQALLSSSSAVKTLNNEVKQA